MIGNYYMGTSGRLYRLMSQWLKERKWSYVFMLMLITLGTSRTVVCKLDSLYSLTRLPLIGIPNSRTQWNLPSLVRSLSPRRQQWSASVASIASYAWWVFPLRDPLICMGTICQLFTTHPDLNILWIRNWIISIIISCARPLPWANCWQHMSGVKIIYWIFVLKWCPVVPSGIIAPNRCFMTLREQSGFQYPKVSWRLWQITPHISMVIFIILLEASLI